MVSQSVSQSSEENSDNSFLKEFLETWLGLVLSNQYCPIKSDEFEMLGEASRIIQHSMNARTTGLI